MKIKQAYAVFGCLANESLFFEDGFNLISLPNEGGKSTWCAFLRVMLYGLDTRERDRVPTKDRPLGVLADKNRYAPLNGAPMSGRLLVDWDGRELEITRSAGKGGPMQSFSARWTDTGEPVAGMTGANCGELLCGVSREGYERSAYISASGPVSAGMSPDLESRINAIVTTGQEEMSAETLRARLNRMENDLYVNKSTGALAKARMERESVEEKIAGLQAILRAQKEWEARRAAAEEAETAASARLALLREHERYRRSQVALDALREVKNTRVKESLCEGKTMAGGVRLDEGWVETGRKKIDETRAATLAAQAEKERERAAESAVLEAGQAEALKAAPPEKPGRTFFWAALCAGILLIAAGAAAWILYEQSPLFAALAACGAVLAAAAAVRQRMNTAKWKQAFQAAEESRRAADAALAAALVRAEEACTSAGEAEQREKTALGALARHFSPFGAVVDVETAAARVKEAEEALVCLRQASAERRAAEAKLSGISSVGAALHVPKPELPPPEEGEEALSSALGEAEAALRRAEGECATLRGQLREAGDPAELFARKEALEQREQTLSLALDGVRLAKQAVVDAAGLLQSQVSPRLTERAEALLRRMTNGKYQRFVMREGFVPQAAVSAADAPLGGAMLSTGTTDQVYLALRLAVCIEALQDKKPPILLDDPLLTFDGEREKAAMELLHELAEEWQILLFTCRPA